MVLLRDRKSHPATSDDLLPAPPSLSGESSSLLLPPSSTFPSCNHPPSNIHRLVQPLRHLVVLGFPPLSISDGNKVSRPISDLEYLTICLSSIAVSSTFKTLYRFQSRFCLPTSGFVLTFHCWETSSWLHLLPKRAEFVFVTLNGRWRGRWL